ncbi:MAG: DUF4139 domain-containing protein [Candidatus Iainarchaeum archaeon]|uniref:DUF4139 domain-containing protein n=1 Tax=Candidatus Iainarchaeum sp. TaxID=3101447 RepID=A0A7T9DJV8_9ARCH|nr:MAG: DUF4139 domain-containing protein [Candidatus Diapherotrites archaeon]
MTTKSPSSTKKPIPMLAAAIVGLAVIAAVIFVFQNEFTLDNPILPAAQPRLVYSNFAASSEQANFQSSTGAPYVTIYNGNLASVSQSFNAQLTSGENEITYTDIPSQIIPASVFVLAPNANTQILKQEYIFDTYSSEALLQRHLGQTITLVVDNGNSVQEITGILRSYQGDIILETGSGVQSISRGSIVSTKFSDATGLNTQPSLVWNIQTTAPGSQALNLSYLTNGVDWQTNYAIDYDEATSSIDLRAWADVSNNTDYGFDNAKLSLVAGTINRASPAYPEYYGGKGAYASADAGIASAPAPSFTASSVSEYHRYDLAFPTSIKSHSSQQLNLLEAENIPVTRELVFDSYSAGAVQATLTFKNNTAGGLGVALPAGTARVYTAVKNFGQTFVGEDTVENTPADKEVKLDIGEVFDVRGERKVLDTSYPSKNCTLNRVEVKLTNSKSVSETVKVVEHTYGDTTISNNNFPYTVKDAQTYEFVISVPANGSQTLNFSANSCYPIYN